MPRIHCHYMDCLFLDGKYCSAAAIELDPDTGCKTYQPNDDIDIDGWDEDEDLDDWEEMDDEEEDDLWIDEDDENLLDIDLDGEDEGF